MKVPFILEDLMVLSFSVAAIMNCIAACPDHERRSKFEESLGLCGAVEEHL